MKTGIYVFIVVLDRVTKTQNLGNEVHVPYQVLEQNQHIMVIRLKELVEWITADKLSLPSRPAGLPLNPSVSAPVVDVQDRILKIVP